MSTCSSTLRVLSRPRVTPPKTLLPFLYQTATIQQWKSAAHPIARRTISYRSSRGHDVPFEGEGEGEASAPTVDEVVSTRKTTITGTERAAFQKLYKTFNAQGERKTEGDHEVELDQIADEYYEDDEEPMESLDKIFGAVMQGSPQLREGVRKKRDKRVVTLKAKNRPLDLNSLAEEIMKSGPRQSASRVKEDTAKAKELRMSERARVDSLLENAKTDRELWDILNKEVLEQVRTLDLDGTNKSPAPKGKSSFKPKSTSSTAVDPQVVFPNYPHHLITAITTLRTNFPSSPLPLTLLPAIKALGRSAYALCATTTLYKHLIRTAWLQHGSYTYIDALLTDMNNGAIEFNNDILALLDSILNEHDTIKSGQLGRESQMVYGMDALVEGVQQLRQWRDVIARRVGAAAATATPSADRRPKVKLPPKRVSYRQLTFAESGRSLVRRVDGTGFVSTREGAGAGAGAGARGRERQHVRERGDPRHNPRLGRGGEKKPTLPHEEEKKKKKKASYTPLVEGTNNTPVDAASREVTIESREDPLDDVDVLLADAEDSAKRDGAEDGPPPV